MKTITSDIETIRTEVTAFLHAKDELKLLSYLDATDFWRAPASTMFHSNNECGLCLHSYHVGRVLEHLALSFEVPSPVEGYTSEEFGFMLGLIHDLCKVQFYEAYLKNVKGEDGKWTSVTAYKVRDDHKSYGHGFTSYFRARKLIRDPFLLDAITYPVLYHMGSYDVSESAFHGYSKAQADFPWLTLLQSADSIAAFVYGF